MSNVMSLHIYLDGVLHNAAVVVVQLNILSEIALIDRFICRFLISQICFYGGKVAKL